MRAQGDLFASPGDFASVRLGLERSEVPYAAPLSSPGAVAAFLLESQPDDGREHFRALYLDVRHRPLALHTVSVGCLTASLVHPREVFGPAMLCAAASVVVTHNHPSGDPEPSAEDLALTRRLAAGGELLGIQMLDHIITGNGSGRFLSLKERGIL